MIIAGALVVSVLAGVSLIQARRPRAVQVARVHGIGVAIDLPGDWAAASDARDVRPPAGLDERSTVLINRFLADPALLEDSARLMGYQGIRTLLVVALPRNGRNTSLESVVDGYLADQTGESGWDLISRRSTSVDDNAAVRMVLERPENGERSLDIAWFEGDQAWLATWDTSIADFGDAEPMFDAAMHTVWTESGT